MKRKIFLLGENKTGTTSLTKAFQILGFKNCPESIWYNSESPYYHNFIKGNYSHLFDLVNQYDFFEDQPWNIPPFYKVLDKYFPNSKFILTLRDHVNWLESARRWSNLSGNKNMFHWRTVSKLKYNVDDWLSLDNEKIYELYNIRNKTIIDYFSGTNKLLVINLETDNKWDKICQFINVPKPNTPFPHLNRTK